VLKPANFLFDRRFYSAVSVFDDRFYVTQTSHWFGLLPLFFVPRSINLVRQHRKEDILKLVITARDRERLVYSPLYGSYDNKRTSEETFRLYVRAEQNTVVKYVFAVADDQGASAVSLEEARTRLHDLVPDDRRSSVPFVTGRGEQIALRIRRRMRNRRILAWMCFAIVAVSAVGVISQPFMTRPTDEKVAAFVFGGLNCVVFGILGWRALRKRRVLGEQLKRFD
jgi:hypothetical protein